MKCVHKLGLNPELHSRSPEETFCLSQIRQTSPCRLVLGGRSVKYGEVPAQLQPMFQLAGLLPRRVEHMEHLEHVEHVEHWCHKAQSFESLRLQLPPGPISAILAICQLQLHYQIFTSNFHFKVIKFSSKAAVSAVSAGSFGRLVISLAMDPEFRAVLGSSGASLALQALRAQLEHCTSGCAEMGRMRFLQVQACALQAQLDGDPEDLSNLSEARF